MRNVEGTLAGAGRFKLYYQSWHPEAQPKATLGILHGLGSHSQLFSAVAATLVPRGYAVYALDLRGHGRSPGQRGYINYWSEFREDLGNFRQLILEQNPNCPFFVLGHSLGAIILLDYELHYPHSFSGMITMAPVLEPAGVPPIRLMIGQLMSRIFPRFTLDTGIPRNACSHDPAIVKLYDNDPLRHTKGTARLATEFLKTVQWVQANLAKLQTPILTLHGSDDIVALPENSDRLFEQISVVDREYRAYPGGCHDLHIDPYAPQVIADIANWLDRHVNGELSLCNLGDPSLSLRTGIADSRDVLNVKPSVSHSKTSLH
jgi:alpha-beta hydrolase superfamily lysophospholipase